MRVDPEARKFQRVCGASSTRRSTEAEWSLLPSSGAERESPGPGVPASPDPDAPLLTRRVGVAPQPGRPPRTEDDNRHEENGNDRRYTQRTDQTGTRRFSEGIEQLPETPDKRLTGRFSRGIERSPNTPEKMVTRRFSHGIEQLPDTPDKQTLGRFSRGIEHHVQRAR
jgi:hypothetical protein